jgi:hypothetical protein
MFGYVWSLYEGEIKEGIGHGFARIIYGETGKSYIGYYRTGIKYGKGIQLKESGEEQISGIWVSNEAIIKKEHIDSFEKNSEPEE